MSDERVERFSGRTLANRYQIDKLRAQGDLCAVYDGRDLDLKRPIVIKIAPKEHAGVYLEAMSANGAVSHPAFLAVYDTLDDGDDLYVMEERIDGRPLSAYLAEGAPVRRAVALTLQLARAIAHLHLHGLTQGDLAPSAVVIDRSAVVHINNVGLAPHEDFYTNAAASVAASGLTTSAETALAALAEDPRRRDIWSIGYILWMLITVPDDVRRSDDACAPRAFRSEAPADLRALVARTLSVADGERMESAEALALALESLDETLGRSASAPRDTLPLAVRALRERPLTHKMGDSSVLHRLIEQHAVHAPDAPTFPDADDAPRIDENETQPAIGTNAPAAAVLNIQGRPLSGGVRLPQTTYRRRAALTPRGGAAFAGANPAWPIAQIAPEPAGSIMRPWTWALIGLVLFVAFFLIGYLVFPQFNLF